MDVRDAFLVHFGKSTPVPIVSGIAWGYDMVRDDPTLSQGQTIFGKVGSIAASIFLGKALKGIDKKFNTPFGAMGSVVENVLGIKEWNNINQDLKIEANVFAEALTWRENGIPLVFAEKAADIENNNVKSFEVSDGSVLMVNLMYVNVYHHGVLESAMEEINKRLSERIKYYKAKNNTNTGRKAPYSYNPITGEQNYTP